LSKLLELGLSHLVLVGGSRDIDEKIRERSDHLLAAEVLPALRERWRQIPGEVRVSTGAG